MSKKRVHEIARELKAQGIELDNKDVVGELVALGYDVKSHSSSLEDDQANAAILKIVQQRKPQAPRPAHRRSGPGNEPPRRAGRRGDALRGAAGFRGPGPSGSAGIAASR